MRKWERIAVNADKFAIFFWIILIIYGLYEIINGNNLAYIVLVIGGCALIIDSIFVIKNINKKGCLNIL